jgi:hypothetical protein
MVARMRVHPGSVTDSRSRGATVNDRLSELSAELETIRDAEHLAIGSVLEALHNDQWTAAHRAVDELRAARRERTALEAEADELLATGAA